MRELGIACAKREVRRVLHPSTSFHPTIPHGDAFYVDERLLEACRRIYDGTDKGWARVIEARVEGRPRSHEVAQSQRHPRRF